MIPPLFQAPEVQVPLQAPDASAGTTPRRFALRVAFAAKRYTIPAACALAVHQLGEALVPVIMGAGIERAVATGELSELILFIVLLGLDFLVLSFAYRFGSRLGLLAMSVIAHKLRSMVTDKLLGAGAGTDRLPGAALSIATWDVTRLAGAVALGLYPIAEFTAIIFAGAILLSLSWQLGLVVLIGVPLMVWLMDRAGAPLRRRSEHEQEHAARTAGKAADLLAGYRIIKGLRAADEATARYRAVSGEALDATLRAKKSQGSFRIAMDLCNVAFLTVVAVLAGLQAVGGSLGVGELITVVGLAQFLIQPLGAFAENFGIVWASALASSRRVLTVLQEPESARGSRTGEPVKPGHVPELEICGITIGAGECVGIDADGEQAALLLDMLAGHGPGARLDGIGLQDPDSDLLLRDLLIAPHEAELFEGSIAENIGHGLGADELAAAAGAAGCSDFLSVMGLDSPVGEGGSRLSGGQRQRVALARALAARAPVLVLHEPTTAVDSVTEAGIADGLRAADTGTTTVLITRSPLLLAAADRVLSGTALLSGVSA